MPATTYTKVIPNAVTYSQPTQSVGSVTNYNAAINYNDNIPYNGISTRAITLATTYTKVIPNSTSYATVAQ